MVTLQVCAFAAPTPGNFIPSLTELEKALKSKKIETIYAFPERAKDKEWCKEIQKRTRVYFLPEAKARILPKTYQLLKKIYKENDVRIVHSHFELYDIPATVMAPKKAKIFWHLHDPIQDGYMSANSLRKILIKLQYGVFSKKAKLLSVSEKHGDFAAKIGFTRKNIKYVPNGLDISRINTDLVDIPKSKKQFLMFGWDVYRKGVDIAVEVIKMMSTDDIQVKIVGQDECEKYLLQNSISSNIVFSQPVADINELYKDASAFLHISRAEGLSYALLEAVYVGLPVICSDIPENAFAKIFHNIIWIQSENKVELKNAIELIAAPEFKVQNCDIEFNRELICKEYSIDTWINRIQEFYLE